MILEPQTLEGQKQTQQKLRKEYADPSGLPDGSDAGHTALAIRSSSNSRKPTVRRKTDGCVETNDPFGVVPGLRSQPLVKS